MVQCLSFFLRLSEQCTINVVCCLLARMKRPIGRLLGWRHIRNCIFYNFDVTWARNKPLLFQVSDLGITYFQSITYQQLATNCLKTIFPWLHLCLLAPSAAKFILIDTWYAHKWKIWRCLVIHHRTSFLEKVPK